MKLTNVEIKTISKEYKLGKIKNIKLIKEGLINNNFIFNTDNGKYIIRFIRKRFDNDFLKFRNIEFKVINFLKNNNYPYHLPIPIKNNKNLILSIVNKKHYWVYKFLPGNQTDELNISKIKSIAKGLAQYHKIIQKINIKTNKKKLKNIGWLIKEYNNMKIIIPKNKLDKLMLDNIDLFESHLHHIRNTKFTGKMILAHSDFQKRNLLFNKNKLISVLDFDNLGWSTISKDLAISLKSTCITNGNFDDKKQTAYLKEYQKFNKLTIFEIKQIKSLIIRNYCTTFWWAYKGNIKDQKRRLKILLYIIERFKKMVNVK